MQLSTAILAIAEIAQQNGGRLPAELARMIQEQGSQPAPAESDFINKAVKACTYKCLWT